MRVIKWIKAKPKMSSKCQLPERALLLSAIIWTWKSNQRRPLMLSFTVGALKWNKLLKMNFLWINWCNGFNSIWKQCSMLTTTKLTKIGLSNSNTKQRLEGKDWLNLKNFLIPQTSWGKDQQIGWTKRVFLKNIFWT